jgi:hypothetical protein
MADQASDTATCCPRCGYDLRGQRTLWTDRCPVEGTCTECGLVFEWAGVFSPTRRMPRWCVEADGAPGGGPVRSFRTLLMMFRPWRFWRELRMSHPVRWRRLLLHGLVMLALVYVVFAVGQGWLAWRQYGKAADAGARCTASQPAHAFNALALPFSDQQPGWWTGPGRRAWRGTWSPREQLEFQLSMVDVDPVVVVMAVAMCLLAPIGFVTLPVSRRRAKVRWAHIARISLYGLLVLSVLAALLYAQSVRLAVRGGWWPRSGSRFGAPVSIDTMTFAALPVLLFTWWGFATSRYLRIRHPWGVAAAVVVMAWLACVLGTAVAVVVRGH